MINKKYFGIVLLLIGVILLVKDINNDSELDKTFCKEEERNSDFCIEIYQPVCGWSDPDKIKCIKYPCAQKYSNSCFACQDENVLYYTEGECPK